MMAQTANAIYRFPAEAQINVFKDDICKYDMVKLAEISPIWSADGVSSTHRKALTHA
jgi:hypothetical protein